MARFVLVHGGFHGGWCWAKVRSRLEAAGHQVAAPDMPGHGEDATPRQGLRMADYARRVADVLAEGEPAILVAHSMGGVIASAACEAAPDRVRHLAYVTALVPSDGKSLNQIADRDPANDFETAMEATEPGAHLLRRDIARMVFYADCDPADAEAALDRLTPEPDAPLDEPIALSDARFGQVAKSYVICDADITLSPDQQAAYADKLPAVRRFHVDSGHSPFLAKPDELTAILQEIAAG